MFLLLFVFSAQSIRVHACVSRFNIYVIYFRFLKGEWRNEKKQHEKMTHKRRTKVTIASQRNESVCKNLSLPRSLSISTAMFTQTLKIVDKQMFCRARSKACRKKQCARWFIDWYSYRQSPEKYAHTLAERIRLPLSPMHFERRVHSTASYEKDFWSLCSTDVRSSHRVMFSSVAHILADQFYTHTQLCVRANGVEQKVIFYSADGQKPNHFVQRAN